MSKPIVQLASYVSDDAMFLPLYEAGCRHFILEHAYFSIRSFSDYSKETWSKRFKTLIATGRAIGADVSLSVNCDFLFHERHRERVLALATFLQAEGVFEIRVQDPALGKVFLDIDKRFQLILNTETGNHNQGSIDFYGARFWGQVVSNELPYTGIASMINESGHFELQVQGPLLIQYSLRRFMAGAVDETDSMKSIDRLAQAEEYPGRYFRFYDTPHGHFMYAYFDRCLLKYMEPLFSLRLSRWIIDGRGESADYLLLSMQTYSAALKALMNGADWVLDEAVLYQLATWSGRAQKPGFFKANKTDRQRRKKNDLAAHETCLAEVVDSVKGRCITVKVLTDFSVSDSAQLLSPEGKRQSVLLSDLKTLWGDVVTTSEGHEYLLLPWQKGSQVKSRIVRI